MKTSISFVIICIIVSMFSQGLTEAQTINKEGVNGRILLNRVMSAANDNRDPYWDWTVNSLYTLETTSGTFTSIRLPYYSNQGPAAAELNVAGDRDIYPADGWVLLLRDFGPGTALPFFILYNKYRGIMRLFYFSTIPQSFTKAVCHLRFQQPGSTAKTTACFSLSDTKEAFYQGYDTNRSIIAIGKVQWHQWCYLDFDVSGYDSNVASKNDPTFVFEINGITESSLVAQGQIDLVSTTTTAHKSSNGFNNFVNGVFSLFDHVNKRYKSTDTAKTTFSNLATQNSGKWWAAPFVAINYLTGKSWFNALGTVTGFIEYALGGGSRSSSQPAPVITNGTVKLNGKITTETPLYSLIMRVSGSNHLDPISDAASNELPLYDVPLGVFNVVAKPMLNVNAEFKAANPYSRLPTGPWAIIADTSPAQNIQVIYNDAVFQSISTQFSHLPPNETALGTRSLSSYNSYGSTISFSNLDRDPDFYSYMLIKGPLFFRSFGIKATLTPRNAATGLEPVVIYKAYSCMVTFSKTYTSTGGGGGGGHGRS
jgi:hypothetical protein